MSVFLNHAFALKLFIFKTLLIRTIISKNCSYTAGSEVQMGYSFEFDPAIVENFYIADDEDYVFALEYTDLNDQENFYTKINSTLNKIDVVNKTISGVKIQSDKFIRYLQLQVFDPLLNITTWLPSDDTNNRSDIVYLSAVSLNSSYFKITSLNQSIEDDLKYFGNPFLRKLIIFYESETCMKNFIYLLFIYSLFWSSMRNNCNFLSHFIWSLK